MPNTYSGWRQGIAIAVASAAVLGGASFMEAQQKAQEPALEIFSAVVVNAEAAGKPVEAGEKTVIRVIVERWSTEQERQALVRAYDQKGPKGLLAALQKTERLGTIRKSIALGWDLHYAIQEPTADGGRRIIVGTDRRVDAWEVDREKKTNYPFTLLELRLDKDDRGEGRISLATKIGRSKDGKTIELDFYSADPLRLQDVRKQED